MKTEFLNIFYIRSHYFWLFTIISHKKHNFLLVLKTKFITRLIILYFIDLHRKFHHWRNRIKSLMSWYTKLNFIIVYAHHVESDSHKYPFKFFRNPLSLVNLISHKSNLMETLWSLWHKTLWWKLSIFYWSFEMTSNI